MCRVLNTWGVLIFCQGRGRTSMVVKLHILYPLNPVHSIYTKQPKELRRRVDGTHKAPANSRFAFQSNACQAHQFHIGCQMPASAQSQTSYNKQETASELCLLWGANFMEPEANLLGLSAGRIQTHTLLWSLKVLKQQLPVSWICWRILRNRKKNIIPSRAAVLAGMVESTPDVHACGSHLKEPE